MKKFDNFLAFNDIFESETMKFFNKEYYPFFASNNFHQLLIKGFRNNNRSFRVYSALPINNKNSKFFFIRPKSQNKINYLFILNVPILKQLLIFFQSFFITLLSRKKIILVDLVLGAITWGAFFGAKFSGKKVISIITDFPEYLPRPKKGLHVFIDKIVLNNSFFYIILSKGMEVKAPILKNRNIVIDGLIELPKNLPEIKKTEQNNIIFTYTGSIFKNYGLKELCFSFMRIVQNNVELHIYGKGDYYESLLDYAKSDKRIKIYPQIGKSEILIVQKQASFLINPRSPLHEFSNFSFPSKNLEYLASGIPTIFFNLPFMDSIYFDLASVIPIEQADDFAPFLNTILKTDYNLLLSKSENARNYVMNFKNPQFQVNKIIESFEK
jgi:hypothetical protein